MARERRGNGHCKSQDMGRNDRPTGGYEVPGNEARRIPQRMGKAYRPRQNGSEKGYRRSVAYLLRKRGAERLPFLLLKME